MQRRNMPGAGADEDVPLLRRITGNARRYSAVFSDAVDELLASMPAGMGAAGAQEDVYDVLMRQRVQQHQHRMQQARQAAGGMGGEDAEPIQELPAVLRRRQ